jgi:hypothetical protein
MAKRKPRTSSERKRDLDKQPDSTSLRPLDLTAALASLRSSRDEVVSGPSAAAVSRCQAVPLTQDHPRRTDWQQGKISLDSWADRSVAELRSVSRGHIRRVCLEAGRLTVVLIAERQANGWSFVARVYHKNEVTCDFVLRAGSNRLLPGSQGFYQWLSDRAPRSIRLVSADTQIEFEKLMWV